MTKPRIIMHLRKECKCRHCGMLIGVVVVRSEKVGDDRFISKNQFECPRQECGKLLGHITTNWIGKPRKDELIFC